ncbi:MAG TPA: AAA domain-containing protein [Longimicrobium sp.]|jgi:predicted RecB family nuclease
MLRLTGSLAAQHFRFRCDRRLRWEMVPPAARGGEIPLAEARPGAGLLTRAGRLFEQRRLAQLDRRFPGAVLSAGRNGHGEAVKLPYARVLEALREPGEARWIVQPELVLPDRAAFAARHGLDPAIAIQPAQPDLIRIRRGADGRLRFGVVDIKWSRNGTLQHFAQVAFYSLVLEEICRAEGLDGAAETRRGWIWTRGARKPRPFALAAYRHHVEELFREELPRVAACAPGEAAWHLLPVCAGCGFFEHCRAEADRTDDLARVNGITPVAKQALHAQGIRTVAALQKASFRKGIYTGSHALESNQAQLKQRVQALAFRKVFDVEGRTHRMGMEEGVRILLSAESDPVTGLCFATGVRVEGVRRDARVFVCDAGKPAAERRMLEGFLAHLAGALDPGRSVHFFVYDAGEMEILRGLLQRHLGDAEAQPAIAALAALLFPDGARPASTAPGTVLLDVVSELFALPVPYAWDLARVSEALQPDVAPAVHRPRGAYGAPFSSQVPFERIHNVWNRRPAGGQTPDEVRAEIVATVESKLAALDSVVRAIRERAARRRGDPRLRLQSAALPPEPAPGDPIADPLLESLRMLTELEAAEESTAIRSLHALPTHDRARRFECIREVELVEMREDGSAVFTFDPECREAKFRPGDFALLLTNDDGRTLTETHRKPWLRRKLSAELVEFDLAADPPRMTLASEDGWKAAQRDRHLDFGRVCVLDRAEADFNTRRVVATLRALAAGRGEAEFVTGLLRGERPADWLLAPFDADAGWDAAVRPASEAFGRPVLNAEQGTAWRGVFERELSVVWGPPGTGKTYLLAWMLIGIAAAAKRAGRPCRILVSAATHRAVVNVLVRIARELEASGIPDPLRVVKLAGRGSEADADLEGLNAEAVPDTHLARILAASDAANEPVVVGSTVWSLWKQMRAMNGSSSDDEEGGDAPVRPLFDVVVIDEASQMKVADSLIALSSIRRGGRVILCGDDQQLAPIIRGSYDPENTLFGSAFTHFAEKFGKSTLRESRRMNRALVRYPRRVFYPGLVSMVPDWRLRLAEGSFLDPVDALLWDVFFRPDEAVVFCTYEGVRATARNPFEAALVARLARLARAGMLDPATGEPYSAEAFRSHAFAAISPHRAQNSAILGELVAGGWPRTELPVVDTVERMQGNEREMIVVSYAVADREYAEREASFLLNPNRFNVAITRPRAKLVVFLSQDILRTLPRDERVMGASLAVKGYARAASGPVRQVELPTPEGGTVQARCHLWPL